jgi:hypothetical protein
LIARAASDAYDLGKTLYVPNAEFYFSKPIVIADVPHIQMDGVLCFTGSGDAITLGSSAENAHCKNLTLAVVNAGEISADSIGIKLINFNSSNIHIRNVENFGVGVQFNGSGKGTCYNIVKFGRIVDNYTNIQLYAETYDSIAGWVNENVFIGGRIAADSDFVAATNNANIERIGVSISGDGTYTHNNNNRFYGISTENQTIAYDLVYAQQNHILQIRTEGCDYAYREQNISFNNVVEIGYGTTDNISLNNYTGTTILIPPEDRDKMYRYPNLIYSSGNLGKNSAVVDTYISTKNVTFYESSSNKTFAYTKTQNTAGTTTYAVKGDDYIQLITNRAVGVNIDTTNSKDFLVCRSLVENDAGRIAVICYDAEGNMLQDDGTIRYHHDAAFFYNSSAFGGCWFLGSDKTDPEIQFTVNENVAKIKLLVMGGTSAAARIKEFSVRAHTPTTVTSEYNSNGASLPNRPNVGAYKISDIVFSTAPTKTCIGWVCIADGEPGTWQNISVATLAVDSDLNTSGAAADSKATGDAINRLSDLVGDTSVSEQIAAANMVYVGPDQPTDPNIKVWINTAEEGAGVIPVLPRIATITLSAANWTGASAPYSQVVEINTVTSATKVELNPTAAQIVSLQNDDIALMAENDGGTVTIYSFGGKPSSDMVLQATLMEVSYV